MVPGSLPNANEWGKLEKKFSLEVIIVNNGSTDNSEAIIDAEKKTINNLIT